MRFFPHISRSSTYPSPNSLAATSTACPKSWVISSVMTDSLKCAIVTVLFAAIVLYKPQTTDDADLTDQHGFLLTNRISDLHPQFLFEIFLTDNRRLFWRP